nr:MAG TPA: hypothetical protein [Caudoviricetes sp.]
MIAQWQFHIYIISHIQIPVWYYLGQFGTIWVNS